MKQIFSILTLVLAGCLADSTLEAAKRTRAYAGLVDYSDSEEEKDEEIVQNAFEKSHHVGFEYINSFLDAKSKAQLAATSKCMHMYQPPFAENLSFIDRQVHDISKKIILPEGPHT